MGIGLAGDVFSVPSAAERLEEGETQARSCMGEGGDSIGLHHPWPMQPSRDIAGTNIYASVIKNTLKGIQYVQYM